MKHVLSRNYRDKKHNTLLFTTNFDIHIWLNALPNLASNI